MIKGIQSSWIILYHIYVIIRNIFLASHILAHHPFAQCCNNFSALKIYESQQISGINMIFICTRKKKEAVVYQSGNETVIQPVGKKDRAAFQTVINILIGVAIGVAIAWFLVLPSKIQKAQTEVNEKYKAVSEQLDARTVQIDELTTQIKELTQEKDSLTTLSHSCVFRYKSASNCLACTNRAFIETTFLS